MYCSAPWTTVQIKNDGQFSYCCMSRDPMGIELNDTKLVEGRAKMIAGETLPVCQSKCLDIEELFPSQRQYLNNMFPLNHTPNPEANPEHIQYIDLRMGNICNYMCLMCGDRDSHLWGKANNKENPYISWAKDLEQYKRIIDFINSCKNLKSISLAGGEPFYNKKQLFDIIDRLPRDIELKFITNVSFCDDEIIDKLNEFKNGRLHCSVDGIGKWAEVQRLRSSWNIVESNLLKFAEHLHDGWILRLVPTFTVLNTHGLPDFIDWYFNNLRSVRKSAIMSYTICTMPERMTLYNIPLDTRKQIANRILAKGYPLTDTLQKLCNAIVQDKTPDPSTVTDLKNYLQYVKDKTGLDVIEELQEVGEVIE